MTRRRLIRLHSVLALAALVLCAAVARPITTQSAPLALQPGCTDTSTHFVAQMDAAQEAQATPVVSSATGFADMQLSPDGTTLTAFITTTIPVSQVILAHIHSPAPPGVSTGVRVNFFLGNGVRINPITPTPTAWTNPYIITVPIGPEVVADMRNGLAYANVHSIQFPQGEVRGQIRCADIPTVVPGASPPPRTGQVNTPCTGTIGASCSANGGVNGIWTKRSSGSFTFSATGPGSVAPSSVPAVFIPTTANVESFPCAAVPFAAPFGTTCTGTTVGDVLQGAIVTIRFPLLGGGTVDITGTVTGAGTAPAAVPVAVPPAVTTGNVAVIAPPHLPPPPLLPPLPPLPPPMPPPPFGPMGGMGMMGGASTTTAAPAATATPAPESSRVAPATTAAQVGGGAADALPVGAPPARPAIADTAPAAPAASVDSMPATPAGVVVMPDPGALMPGAMPTAAAPGETDPATGASAAPETAALDSVEPPGLEP